MRIAALTLVTVIASVSQLFATEVLIQIVDGLDRPLPGVHFEVRCEQQAVKLVFESNRDGTVHVTYDASQCTPSFFAHLAKAGYEAYDVGIRSRYVLRREFGPDALQRLDGLKGDDLTRELREMFGGTFGTHEGEFERSLFRSEARLRPTIAALLSESAITVRARQVLTMIGVPDDLHLILRHSPPSDEGAFAERWRYFVATSLINPDGEDEWEFLRRCASNEFNDRWVDAGAIQTLKLTGSNRARGILGGVRKRNSFRKRDIDAALKYIDRHPPTLVGDDLDTLAKRAAKALNLGTWEGNDAPFFTAARDKALVDMRFHSGMDSLIYTATFHKADDVWKLRGVRETFQGFAPGFVAGPRK